jgi:hypothetical protein
MAFDPVVDVEGFWRDGFTIVKGVYTPEEISDFRAQAKASSGWGGDLLSNPRLRSVLTDGRMATVARKILGEDTVVYAGDSSYTINSGSHNWHKDNTDRDDPNAPDWQGGRYTLLRFGVYLQDHTRHSGGLNLRIGSHKTAELMAGKNKYVDTAVGDLAVWSMAISHCGTATKLRFPWWIDPEPDMDGKYPWYWLPAPSAGDRMALFVALGPDDAHHDRYNRYLKTRTYICDMWRRHPWDDETIAEAEAAGLSIRNMPKEIEGDESVGKNQWWQPMAY